MKEIRRGEIRRKQSQNIGCQQNIKLRHQRTSERRYGKGGSVFVEAAVFLPIFLVALLTLALFMRIVAIEETAVHILSDEARTFSVMPVSFHFTGESQRRLRNAWGGNLQNVHVSEFQTGFSQGGIDDLVKVRLSYQIKLPLPIPLLKKTEESNQLVFRQFTGKKAWDQPMDFAEMEREGEDSRVWVFPRAGERYHNKRCSFIAVDPERKLLTSHIRKKYSPCTLCHPQELPDGSAVYCFPHSGAAYHRQSCKSVSRYVVEMDRQAAEQRGYTPCKKCGG